MKNEIRRTNGGRDYDFFDEAMHDFFPSFFGGHHAQRYMRTDIKESDDSYTLEVELPGVDKKDIDIDLHDGYLNIAVN